MLYHEQFEYGFSIIIPTWDNLDYLKTCIRSIQKHSDFNHEIIVHINGGNDKEMVKAYLEDEKITYTITEENEGVCVGVNTAYKKTTKDLILYSNDDMYFLPHWDTELMNMVKKREIPECSMISSSMIEPTGNNVCCIAPRDYGTDLNSFQEEKLLKDAPKLSTFDKQSTTWPPTLWSRKYFEKIGGFDERYSPGMGSDPDLAKKMYDIGCRHFVIAGKSLVYHFQTKSTGRVKRNDGDKDFERIHGMTIHYFVTHVLCRKKIKYKKPLPDVHEDPQRFFQKLVKLFTFSR